MRKSLENDRLRMVHMLDEARYAHQYARGKTRLDFDNRDHLYTVAYALHIVCEAACNVTKETQNAHPAIDWKQITGMRQWLVHIYYKIDPDILWKTVHEHLPSLILQLENILGEE